MLSTQGIDLSWKSGDLNSFLPVILSLICFIIYWFTVQSNMIKESFYSKYPFDEASVKHIFFTKYFGFLSLGLVPALVCLILLPQYSLADYGLVIIPETAFFSLVWAAGLSIVVIPFAYINAKKPHNIINYPQVRAKTWNNKIVFTYASGWALYLLGYEFLFRGVLLFPLVDSIGVWPAIAVNIALYSATHIPKGFSETLGAIPLGLVLCLLTLASGTIWIAVVVHIALAWTNSFTALKYNPEMTYQR